MNDNNNNNTNLFCDSGKENVVVFDFLGKDSIRYYNEVPVEKRVFKNLLLFKENKQPQDDLFDRLNVSEFSFFLSLSSFSTASVSYYYYYFDFDSRLPF